MSELTRRGHAAAQRLDPRWNDHEVEQRLGKLNARIHRRAALRAIAGGVVAAIAAATAVAIWLADGDHGRTPAVANTPATAVAVVHVGDRAVVTPLSSDAVVVAAAVGPREAIVRLDRGGAHFEVRPDSTQLFRVYAGSVEIDVVGTEFTVVRRQIRVYVAVTRGAVRVRWVGGARTLRAGERGEFPPERQRAAADVVDSSPQVPSVSLPADPPSGVPRAAVTEAAVAESVHSAAEPAAAEAVDALLEQADLARLSARPREAIALLERALALSPDAKREAIAAFTLGRVYLDELDSPERAARAFHRARMTDPDGPLAEDALAREVQAWSLAGKRVLARERADEYFERYPSPRRARLVEQYGGRE